MFRPFFSHYNFGKPKNIFKKKKKSSRPVLEVRCPASERHFREFCERIGIEKEKRIAVCGKRRRAYPWSSDLLHFCCCWWWWRLLLPLLIDGPFRTAPPARWRRGSVPLLPLLFLLPVHGLSWLTRLGSNDNRTRIGSGGGGLGRRQRWQNVIIDLLDNP